MSTHPHAALKCSCVARAKAKFKLQFVTAVAACSLLVVMYATCDCKANFHSVIIMKFLFAALSSATKGKGTPAFRFFPKELHICTCMQETRDRLCVIFAIDKRL